MKRLGIAAIGAICILHVSADARADGLASLGQIRDDEPAFSITPPGGDTSLALVPRASLQVRGMLPLDDLPKDPSKGDLTTNAGFMIRRVRVGADVTILPTVTAHVSTDLVDAITPPAHKTPLVQAYGNVDLRLFSLRAGFLRVPFTRHALVDETRQVFVEPPTAWRADRMGIGLGAVPSMLPDRRVGFLSSGDYSIFSYAVGAFSGGGEGATEVGSSLVVAGRVEVTPWGAPPLEGAFFKDDYEAHDVRLAFAAGGLGRTGPNGSTRAISASFTMSYLGLFTSLEGAIGVGETPGVAPDVHQRALTLDVAYRFPWILQGFELGGRADIFSLSRDFGDGNSDLRSVAAVLNLYVWRHRIKASTIVRATKALNSLGAAREREESLLELTFGF